MVSSPTGRWPTPAAGPCPHAVVCLQCLLASPECPPGCRSTARVPAHKSCALGAPAAARDRNFSPAARAPRQETLRTTHSSHLAPGPATRNNREAGDGFPCHLSSMVLQTRTRLGYGGHF